MALEDASASGKRIKRDTTFSLENHSGAQMIVQNNDNNNDEANDDSNDYDIVPFVGCTNTMRSALSQMLGVVNIDSLNLHKSQF